MINFCEKPFGKTYVPSNKICLDKKSSLKSKFEKNIICL